MLEQLCLSLGVGGVGGVCHGRNRPSFLLFQLIRSFLWGQLVHGSQQKLTGEEKMGHVVLPEQAG